MIINVFIASDNLHRHHPSLMWSFPNLPTIYLSRQIFSKKKKKKMGEILSELFGWVQSDETDKKKNHRAKCVWTSGYYTGLRCTIPSRLMSYMHRWKMSGLIVKSIPNWTDGKQTWMTGFGSLCPVADLGQVTGGTTQTTKYVDFYKYRMVALSGKIWYFWSELLRFLVYSSVNGFPKIKMVCFANISLLLIEHKPLKEYCDNCNMTQSPKRLSI